jgi:hypothetical protein
MSNLCEKLLKTDPGDADKLETRKIKSKKLAKVLGEKEAEITVQEISGDRLTEFTSMGLNKNGDANFNKAYEINQLICTDAIIDPNVKNPELMKHFKCATPQDLVKTVWI